MKRSLLAPLIFAILLPVLFSCSKTGMDIMSQTNTADTSKKYLALGDSYTIGQSVTESERFPNQAVSLLRSQGVKINDPKIIATTGWTTKNLIDAINANSPQNNYDVVSISSNQNYLFASDSNTDNGFEKGNITQNLKYFEMPLEISYALLNKKKASITMNTGGFVGKLISNDILLNGNSIGENSNVKQFVYGTLLSSTLQYEFFKKTKFFVEPGMNYYINPLENQSFNQFQWMFNVGLNVSF